MNINFKKLNNILESKSNRAIDKLEELKCTTDEYKVILDSIFNNLEALKKLQEYDIDCPDCKEKVENLPVKETQPTSQTPNKNTLIGKKWVSFKKEKGDK